MITMQKMNVVKIVDNEVAAAKLKEKGFELVSHDAPAVAPSSLPNDSDGGGNPPFQCPYCTKEYKTQEGLDKHMAEKHPSAGGDGNDTGTGTGADNAGSSGQP